MRRTHYCGDIRECDIGAQALCMGWVLNKRDMGGVLFIDLKDRQGVLQVVCSRERMSEDDFHIVEQLTLQSVIEARGRIFERGEDTYNPRLPTGTVELRAEGVRLLSAAAPLPYQISDDSVREELRLKYRYLDLRRQEMYRTLKFRSDLVGYAEEFLKGEGFVQVETPMLCKSTPEGARDYLVPSRVHPGSYYALPQSPQIYKQLLMVGGIDRYYQVARCFRDEDLRADRQPEFTQVDMEMSFVEQEDVLEHLEKLFRHLFRRALNVELPQPLPRLTWTECMDSYGSDKPDLRFDLKIIDLTDIAARCGFSVFKRVAASNGVVRAICVPGKSDFTRTEIEELTDVAMRSGAKGMAWIAWRPDGELYSVLTKYFSHEDMDALLERVGAHPGDFILFCADTLAAVRRTLGVIRLHLGDMLGIRDTGEFKLMFVTDFPQFEYSEEEKRFVAMHHPFTMPNPEDMQYLESDPARVRALAYDVVLNGIELGSGSIRIHDSEIQARMFRALGFSPEEIENRFGFMVHAFSYGTPPHGGFAFGLDRLVMQMLDLPSLRDVVAFPKVRDASCPMTEAPTPVDEEQLKALGLTGKAVQTAAGDASADSSARYAPWSGGKPARRQSDIDIDLVARLSRLNIPEVDRAAMEADMRAIVEFAGELSELDTTGVPVMAHAVALDSVLRDDVAVKYENARAMIEQSAPEQYEGMPVVPRTFA